MIKPLNTYDLPDTKSVRDDYEWKDVPDISAKNLEIFMDKINEIIHFINGGEYEEVDHDTTKNKR